MHNLLRGNRLPTSCGGRNPKIEAPKNYCYWRSRPNGTRKIFLHIAISVVCPALLTAEPQFNLEAATATEPHRNRATGNTTMCRIICCASSTRAAAMKIAPIYPISSRVYGPESSLSIDATMSAVKPLGTAIHDLASACIYQHGIAAVHFGKLIIANDNPYWFFYFPAMTCVTTHHEKGLSWSYMI